MLVLIRWTRIKEVYCGLKRRNSLMKNVAQDLAVYVCLIYRLYTVEHTNVSIVISYINLRKSF